jgi:hypothetical protein
MDMRAVMFVGVEKIKRNNDSVKHRYYWHISPHLFLNFLSNTTYCVNVLCAWRNSRNNEAMPDLFGGNNSIGANQKNVKLPIPDCFSFRL